MCRNIHPLFNFEPPANEEEIRLASVQFVRKVSGFTKPSTVNAAAFDVAVEEVSASVAKLLGQLQTTTAPKDRAEEAAKARARAARRYGTT
jgi:hypothetical protein